MVNRLVKKKLYNKAIGMSDVEHYIMLHPPLAPEQANDSAVEERANEEKMKADAMVEHLWEGAYGPADVKRQRALRLEAMQRSKWQDEAAQARKDSKFPHLHGLYRHRHDEKEKPQRVSGQHPLLPELLAEEQKEKVCLREFRALSSKSLYFCRLIP